MSLEIHAVSTTVSCQVSGGDGHLSAEVDGRAWGYNGGRSQYFDGDTCFVIVYKSVNTDVVGYFATGGAGFAKENDKAVGYNIKRQGVSFSSPIGSSDKPMPARAKINGSSFFKTGGAEYLVNTTVIRLRTWSATLSPEKPPPYGFMFIEYEPYAEMWSFTNLKANITLLSTEVHGVIFAITTPMSATFSPFS